MSWLPNSGCPNCSAIFKHPYSLPPQQRRLDPLPRDSNAAGIKYKNPHSTERGFLFTLNLLLERNRAVAHAARGRDGRQEGRERGYYNLHRHLNDPLLHTLVLIKVCSTISTGTTARIDHQARSLSGHCEATAIHTLALGQLDL